MATNQVDFQPSMDFGKGFNTLQADVRGFRSRLDEGASSTNVTAFLDALSAEAKNHRAVRHCYLRALRDGTVPDLRWALADFGRQYFGYSAHFPRYLTTTISRLDKAEHRAALLENLTEESGVYGDDELKELAAFGVEREWIVGIPHPKLFQRFRRALGVPDTASGAETEHNLFVPAFGFRLQVKAGETARKSTVFEKPGEFEYNCDLPGHRDAGMKGTLIVRAF